MSQLFDRITGKQTDITPSGEFSPKDDEVLLSEKLVQRFDDERTEWARAAVEDNAFRNNMQLSEQMERELAQRNQSPVTFNLIHPAVENAKAMLTNNAPRFQSTAKEDSDVATGRLFSDIMSHIWANSRGNAEFEQHVDDFYVTGMGCWIAWSDPRADMGKGEVFIKELDPLKVFIDPSSTDRFARDAPHIIIADLMTGEQVQEFEPFVKDILAKAQPTTEDRAPVAQRAAYEGQRVQAIKDTEEVHYEVLDRYSKVKVTRTHVFERASGKEHLFDEDELRDWRAKPAFIVSSVAAPDEFVIDPEGVAELEDTFTATGGVFHFIQLPDQQLPTGETIAGGVQMAAGPETENPEAIPASTVELTRTTIGNLIEAHNEDDRIAILSETLENRIKRVYSIGGQLVSSETMELDQHPIVPVMNRHNRNPYPLSDVRQVRGLQEYYNKLKSDILAHLSNAKSIKAFVPHGTDRDMVEREFNKAGFGVVEYDPELGAPVMAQVPSLSSEIYLEADRIELKIQKILGIFDLSAGDPRNAPQTFKGTIAIDDFGQRRIKSKREMLEAGLNVLGRVVLQLIQQTYSEQKTIRLFQPSQQPREVSINQPIYHEYTGEQIGKVNDVTTGRYDIVVVSGSTLPNNRWARFEYYRDLYRDGVIDQVELLKQTDVADIEGVLERSSQIAQLQGALEQAQQQIKDLQGDLQTARRESVHDQKRLEVQKFKSDLEEQSTEAKKQTQLFTERMNDKLKNFNTNGN